MTKIDIISGFLGAGKTTLIKKLLSDGLDSQKVMLIENEFGEIGIDGGFLKDSGIKITEMNSGCICCSLSGDFSKALKKAIDEYAPERIIIEPSGVGKLSDVIEAVKTVLTDDIILNSFSTVADANRFKIYHKNFGEFFNNQIAAAQVIILSHTAGLSEEKINACVDIIKQLNDDALIVTTDWDSLTGKQMLTAIESGSRDYAKLLLDDHEHHEHNHEHHEHHGHEHDHHEHEHHHEHGEGCTCGCHDHDHEHHHADDVFISWGKQTFAKYSEKQLKEILSALLDSGKYGNVLRAKGIVQSDNGSWFHFDYVPGEPEIRTGSADVTGRICVIGSEINEQELDKLFA